MFEILEAISELPEPTELQRFRLVSLLCKPVLCELCDAVLIPEMPEEERDRLIMELEGDKLFFSSSRSLVCPRCHERDEDEIEDEREACHR